MNTDKDKEKKKPLYFIRHLPLEIINKIIPYTYHLQNPLLLSDIKNFCETKEELISIYNTVWIRDFSQYPNASRYWLINDILAYTNNYHSLYYGYIPYFYTIFLRHINLHTKTEVDQFIQKFLEMPINMQINIFWSLLGPDERFNIVAYHRMYLD
jgi:hypothetical protein